MNISDDSDNSGNKSVSDEENVEIQSKSPSTNSVNSDVYENLASLSEPPSANYDDKSTDTQSISPLPSQSSQSERSTVTPLPSDISSQSSATSTRATSPISSNDVSENENVDNDIDNNESDAESCGNALPSVHMLLLMIKLMHIDVLVVADVEECFC